MGHHSMDLWSRTIDVMKKEINTINWKKGELVDRLAYMLYLLGFIPFESILQWAFGMHYSFCHYMLNSELKKRKVCLI